MEKGTRTLWKGAITFGLVHIPVGLHTAATEQGVDFDWLDKRTMDPVGYKRINKRTGREVTSDNIVKGVKYKEGHYVIISPQEIAAAFPKTTQTIEIERFIDAAELPFVFLERPYYVAPLPKAERVYTLLRETLIDTKKIALAKVVISTKQHLATLVPSGKALVLNLLRWGDEVKTLDVLELPPAGRENLTASEMKMAKQLVTEMTGSWKPEDFENEFRQQIMKIVKKKVKAGEAEIVLPPQEKVPETSNVIDLTVLLKQSLNGGAKASGSPAKRGTSAKSSSRRPAAKKAVPKKKAA